MLLGNCGAIAPEPCLWLVAAPTQPHTLAHLFFLCLLAGWRTGAFVSVMSVCAGGLYGDDTMASGLLLVSRMLRAQSECPSLENKKHPGCVCVYVCLCTCVLDMLERIRVHVHAVVGEGNVRSNGCMFTCRKQMPLNVCSS